MLNRQKRKNNPWLYLALLLLVSLVAGRHLFGEGLFSLHDDLHVAWIDQMSQSLRSGQFPPRWVPDLSFNYGYPLFIYVYPLPFLVGAFFHGVGLSLVGSLKAIFLLSLIGSGWAMFGFARRKWGDGWAFLISLFYLFTPYRALTIFVRGTIGEALVFVFLPLVIWGLEEALSSEGRLKIKLGGAALAGLILAHNIGSFMALPFVGLYGLLLVVWPKFDFKKLKRLFCFFGWGLGLSLFFWLPGLIEKRFMVVDTVFNYWDHFPFIKQLILPSWGYGISTWGPYDGLSFQIGVINLIVFGLFGLSFLLHWKQNKKKAWPFFLASSTLLSLFLMNIRSSFLWELIPLLPYFQFPWRFLMMTTFFTPLMLVGSVELLPKKVRLGAGIVLVALALGLTVGYFRPEIPFPDRDDAYYLTRYLPAWSESGRLSQATPEYQKNTEEYLRLPLWTESRPTELPAEWVGVSQGMVVAHQPGILNWEGDFYSQVGEEIWLNQYYYPGWRLEVDGKRVEVQPAGESGRVTAILPTNEGSFNFFWQETFGRRVVNWISGLGWLLIGASVLKLGLEKWRKNKT